MNMNLQSKAPDGRVGEIIKLAVLAVGGQGGGVLTGWIEALARSQGYACQATSVAGVAQRTGATIYYVEMTPKTDLDPVFALAPSSGDVDILIASEMMEVGRAVMRGFVTPDRTTLIGSTHRALAVSEKMAPGDGIADADEVRAAAEIAAQRLILADMDRPAVEQGSVISSTLFGALAGSGALPFSRSTFEDAIRAGGKGVEPSLRAFALGFDVALGETSPAAAPARALVTQKISGPARQLKKWDVLAVRLQQMPVAVQDLALAGLRKVVDFQDCAYGAVYLDRLDKVIAKDDVAHDWALSTTAAKYIANAMAYDDIIRVADLKTRKPRFDRIRNEMKVSGGQLIELTEFFHPRAEEMVSLLPAKMGVKWQANPRRMAILERFFGKGQRLKTHRLRSFLMLHFLGGLKGYRLRTLRHAVEVAHLDTWLSQSLGPATEDYELSVEMLKCRRLIKGYSDTHARGKSKFSQVMDVSALLAGRDDAALWVARLREAALQDPDGEALEGAIETVRSFL
ncbi:MAG: indolepyruvate ferredoxin oxidoreductase beta subunit [Paracoccaceae bacterium]|jgi:indolepyruvate ferredoxin oxidoreductase beta subunit